MSVLDRFRLDGKRAFVTGASRGIGRSIALALAEAGADLVLNGREPDALEKSASEVRRRGRRAWAVPGDVGRPAEAEALAREVLERHGPIDILVNNVGGRRQNIPTEEMPLETWRELVDLNLTSAFVATKILGGDMLRRGRGGRILNVASINAFVAGRRIAGRHYETAKAALVQFTRAVAADWAPKGVTVNAICPGGIMTDANRRWQREKPEVIEGFKAAVPMGDFGEPDDLGPLAVYLASDASRYMTGAAIVIDGGYTLW
jgi:gluconate 5-dehydrogenase